MSNSITQILISSVVCVRSNDDVLSNYLRERVSNRIGAKSIITTKPDKITLNNPVEIRKVIETMM